MTKRKKEHYAIVPDSIIRTRDTEKILLYCDLYLLEVGNVNYTLTQYCKERSINYPKAYKLLRIARQVLGNSRMRKSKENQKEINGKKKEKLSLYDLEDYEVEELKEKNKSKKVVKQKKINGKTFSGTPVVAGLSDALQLELESCIITNELISDELINNLPISEREIYIAANYDRLKDEGRL